MAEYPRDEFDDLAPTGRKGAHRRDGGPTTQAGAIALVAILAIAALLLVLGAINIIRSSTADPEEQVAEQAPTAESTADPTAEEDTSVDIDQVEKTAEVTVLNASGVSGAGGAFGDAVEEAGWTLSQVGNHSTSDTVSSIHYADEASAEEAQALGELLGITDVEHSEEFTGDITVVVCSDIANDPPAPAGTGDAAEDTGA